MEAMLRRSFLGQRLKWSGSVTLARSGCEGEARRQTRQFHRTRRQPNPGIVRARDVPSKSMPATWSVRGVLLEGGGEAQQPVAVRSV